MSRIPLRNILFGRRWFSSIFMRRIESLPLGAYRQSWNGPVSCATFPNCKSEKHVIQNQMSTYKHWSHSDASATSGNSFSPVTRKTVMMKLVSLAPTKIQPYLYLVRLDKPIGTWLLLCPSWWSIGMSTYPGNLPDLYFLTLFGVGAVLIRGAGCTINDMWDRRFDAKVERTKNRPLVSGQINSLHALAFLGLQLSLALLVLLQLNTYSIILGFCSLPFIITYPLMKRVTYWPQLFLGMTFNWGILMGWTAIQGTCDWSVVLPLYAAGICWTLIYDTIYAHQDRDDDVALKLKSTAIKFGEDTRKWLMGFTASMVTFLTISGLNCNQTWPYYAALGITMSQLFFHVATLDINNSQDCWNKFQANKRIGLIIFGGIIAGTVLKKNENKNQLESTDNSEKHQSDL